MTRKLALHRPSPARSGCPMFLDIHEPDYAADLFVRGGRADAARCGAALFAAAVLDPHRPGHGGGPEFPVRCPRAAGRAPPLVLPNAVPGPRLTPRAASEIGGGCTPCTSCSLVTGAPARACRNSWRGVLASSASEARRWRATLAGGGPAAEFQSRAAALGLCDRVAFPRLDRSASSGRPFALTADILALPLHAEGLANAAARGSCARAGGGRDAGWRARRSHRTGTILVFLRPRATPGRAGGGLARAGDTAIWCYATAGALAPASASSTVSTSGLVAARLAGLHVGLRRTVPPDGRD